MCDTCPHDYDDTARKAREDAKQENLFIGMIHAFQYMGIPEYVLTDNMKSVVDHRDMSGKPVWNREYEAFMNTLCFKTKLCKPRHPYTKGKVERLVRFVKGNFLAGRTFWNVTDLNQQALEWCDKQNGSFHKGLYGIIDEIGHCEFDKENTRLFFDLIDRRYNKEGAYNIVFTSNRNPSLWRENFHEEDSLLCALDRIFDAATVFNIHGESFRGKHLETYALQVGKVTTAHD